jgi:protein ImuB
VSDPDGPAPRVLAVWCPDWPVVAAGLERGIPAHRPVAVLRANRVLACSATARAQGVRRGLRGREAQARCPELVVLPVDRERDTRVFERVVRAVEDRAPGVEVVRPGLLVMPAQGPIGYFGGVREAAVELIDHVAARTRVECQIGVADGLFAATLAAHRGLLVEPGRSAEFLAPLEIGELDREPEVDRSELVDLLRRLGLRSLGAFAALPASDVASRFGSDAVLCHRLSRGREPRLPARRRPVDDLVVGMELDPPVARVDQAAFAARALAGRWHDLLAAHGLACTRLGIRARTRDGRELARTWRCAEPLTPAGTVDRTRWQLDAWLSRRTGPGPDEPDLTGDENGGISALWLTGEQVVPAGELQLGLWGGTGEADERAGRALVRVQALLGHRGVCTPVLVGGREPGERVRLVPWGDERRGAEVPAGEPEPPWPGRLPAPSPGVVSRDPVPVALLDGRRDPVGFTERAELTAAPALLAVDGGAPVPVAGWAGPWAVECRWWDPATGWRGALLQVLLSGDTGEALLLRYRDGNWGIAGRYG